MTDLYRLDPKPELYQLTKLQHRLDSHIERHGAAVQEDETFTGNIQYEPKIDNVLHFHLEIPKTNGDNYLRTSLIKSILVQGSENDKLVIPSDFPEAYRLKIPELKEGDTLFATSNSVYHLRRIQ